MYLKYWSELPFPSPGDLPNPGIEPRSPTLQADALPSEPPGKLYLLPWFTAAGQGLSAVASPRQPLLTAIALFGFQ